MIFAGRNYVAVVAFVFFVANVAILALMLQSFLMATLLVLAGVSLAVLMLVALEISKDYTPSVVREYLGYFYLSIFLSLLLLAELIYLVLTALPGLPDVNNRMAAISTNYAYFINLDIFNNYANELLTTGLAALIVIMGGVIISYDKYRDDFFQQRFEHQILAFGKKNALSAGLSGEGETSKAEEGGVRKHE